MIALGDPRLPDKFWRRVVPDEAGCWIWTGPVAGRGYGTFYVDHRKQYVHRLVLDRLVAPIAPGLHVDHVCRVLRCCNPRHLEPVTCRENLLRGVGPSARAAAATCCPAGHPYTGENLYVDPRGNRQCMECRRIARRKSWHHTRAA